MSCHACNGAPPKPTDLEIGGGCGNKSPCGQRKSPCPAEILNHSNEWQPSAEASEPPCLPCLPCRPCPPSCEEELRVARKKYDQLQADFKGKITEIGVMRIAQEKLKQLLQDTEDARKAAEKKAQELKCLLIEFDNKFGEIEGGGAIEFQQQLAVAREMYEEVQKDLMDMTGVILDNSADVKEWMDKSLEAQQIVEEQKRRIDILELNSNRANEQVCLEIQRLRNQFTDKLYELIPLPGILESTKMKLQEAQQKQSLAEQNNEGLESELQMSRDHMAVLTEELELLKNNAAQGVGEKEALLKEISDLKKTIAELEVANVQVKSNLEVMTNTVEKAEDKVQEHMLKVAQLTTDLENLREESADRVARIQDRSDIIKENMQFQISDLEGELVLSRTQTSTALKDRDEIREKMQEQIHILQNDFEDAQMRIRNVQGHVNFLKNSYNAVCIKPENPDYGQQDPCRCGCNS